MSETQYVPEVNVLVGVAKWLHSNGWRIERISMPHGKGIDSIRNKAKLESEFIAVGISMNDIEFSPTGEDIRARQGDNLWKIECKGLSNATHQTDKSNFDRAIASTVSYYDRSDGLRLGIAMPEDYLMLLRRKIPHDLRVAINLWVFLYATINEIWVFAPDEEIP